MTAQPEITNLIYTYAELLDGGDLDGVARLFEHGRICGVEDGPPETVFAGAARVREMYEMATRIYADGTPKTKHNTTNVQLHIDEAEGTARSTSYYCVTQATPDLPLQVIVTGHYKDTFRAGGRRLAVRQPHHVRRPGRQRQPAFEVLNTWQASSPFDLAFEPAAVMADAQRKEALTDWGPGEFEGPLRVLLADYAGADLNAIGVHILRSGIVHSLRMRLRAQEWIRRHPEILDERVAAPIVVVGMMRSGTTLLQRLLAADPRFVCAYGWEVVEVAPRLEYEFTGVDPRIAISEAREAKSRELAPELFAIHPMYARRSRGRDRLPGRRVSVPCPRIRCPPSPLPVLARRAGLLPRLRLLAPHAAIRAVAETSARAGRAGAGCSNHRRTWGIWICCARSSPTCTSCTCIATRAPRSPRGPA